MAHENHDTIYMANCILNATVPAKATEISKDASPQEVIYKRRHPVYVKRIEQLMVNLLGLEGGREYVRHRLSRFAGETSIDWCGGKRSDGSEATGRLQQTHAFPYLGRINEKINQYVFSKEPEREGADIAVLKDITRDGRTINDVMREVSSLLFSCRWCWIGVHAPLRKADGTQYTLAEKEAQKIRPYWQVYSPDQVLDWHFNTLGELEWIKTIEIKYDDADPSARPNEVVCVRLWEKGKVTDYIEREKKDNRGKPVYDVIETTVTLTDQVPFIPVGNISAKAAAFDDLESINRTIMDLGSVDRANFFNCSYPQMVLPASIVQNLVQSGYATNATEAGKLITGFKNPLLVDKDEVQPYLMTPDSGSMMSIGERILQLKRELFEVVGLALEQESRQVASAEAKAWDFLDVSSVMKSRAEVLQDAEQKAVDLSKAWDADFQEWQPVYNKDFDIGNFKDEISALVMLGNMPLPVSVLREVTRKVVDRIDRIGAPIDDDKRKEILGDIDNWSPSGFGIDTPAIETE